MTPMPPHIAKDEDLLREALLISLGSSIIGAGRQTDGRICHVMARVLLTRQLGLCRIAAPPICEAHGLATSNGKRKQDLPSP
jgi:hypothetical protein